MRSWSTHALGRTLSRAGSSGASDHPPAPRPQAGGRLPQTPPPRRGLGTPYGNDRGVWTEREVVLIPHQGPIGTYKVPIGAFRRFIAGVSGGESAVPWRCPRGDLGAHFISETFPRLSGLGPKLRSVPLTVP